MSFINTPGPTHTWNAKDGSIILQEKGTVIAMEGTFKTSGYAGHDSVTYLFNETPTQHDARILYLSKIKSEEERKTKSQEANRPKVKSSNI